MKQPDFTIIKDLQELRSFVTGKRSFSISAPLQVGSEFMLAVCQVDEVSECVCVHLQLEQVREVADILFSDRERRVVVHALKEIVVWFRRHGVELYAEMFLDVSLAAYLLAPPEPDLGEDWRKFVLSSLVEKYLREPYPVLYKQVLQGEYPEVLYERLVQDAWYVWRLGPILVNGILADETLLQPYWELEILLTSVLADMECHGIGLDRARIARALPRVERAMDVLGKQLATLYGQEFKPGSEGDVRRFLYRTCGVRLKRNEHINDDLLKGLARSYLPAFKLRTWRRLSLHSSLKKCSVRQFPSSDSSGVGLKSLRIDFVSSPHLGECRESVQVFLRMLRGRPKQRGSLKTDQVCLRIFRVCLRIPSDYPEKTLCLN